MSWGGVRWSTTHIALQKREPGLYEISELLREHWPRQKGPGRYGTVFKWMAKQRYWPRLRWVGVKRNGHQLYEVLPHEPATADIPTTFGSGRVRPSLVRHLNSMSNLERDQINSALRELAEATRLEEWAERLELLSAAKDRPPRQRRTSSANERDYQRVA